MERTSNSPQVRYCRIFAISWRGLYGLATKSSQPASRAFLSPSVNAWEVTAMIGIDRSAG